MANLIHIGVLYSAILAGEGPQFYLLYVFVCFCWTWLYYLPKRPLESVAPEISILSPFLNSLIIFFIYLIHSSNSYTNINIQTQFFHACKPNCSPDEFFALDNLLLHVNYWFRFDYTLDTHFLHRLNKNLSLPCRYLTYSSLQIFMVRFIIKFGMSIDKTALIPLGKVSLLSFLTDRFVSRIVDFAFSHLKMVFHYHWWVCILEMGVGMPIFHLYISSSHVV